MDRRENNDDMSKLCFLIYAMLMFIMYNLPNSQWISDTDQSPSESQRLFSPHLHTGLSPV